MKAIISSDNKTLKITIEHENYFDTFTFFNYATINNNEKLEEIIAKDYHNHFDYNNYVYTDNGKGWRLNKLERKLKNCNESYELDADPKLSDFDGYHEYNVIYKWNDFSTLRIITLSECTDDFNYVGKVALDNCMIESNNMIGKKERKSMRYYECFGNEDNNREQYGEDIYFNDEQTDFFGTNSVVQTFIDFKRNVRVFGNIGESPKILHLVGNYTATYDVEEQKNGDKKVLCKRPNKYTKLDINICCDVD